jgi:hypothetical protein
VRANEKKSRYCGRGLLLASDTGACCVDLVGVRRLQSLMVVDTKCGG